MRRALLVLTVLLGCGDNGERLEVFTATSGTRLALQKYRFDDGTEQAAPGELYDRQVHTRCARGRWIDGAVRCVPVADEAVYTDAACTMLVGRSVTMEKPSHFVAYESRGGTPLPARVFRAAAPTDPPDMYFERSDGACVGPFSTPSDVTYFTLGDEIDGSALAEVRDDEIGDGRIALELHTSDDGMRVPFEVRDRMLDLPCEPVPQRDGSVLCEPIGSAPASYFGDPGCTAPVVVVEGTAPPPTLAALGAPSGCAEYRAIDREVTSPVYQLAAGVCRRAAIASDARVFSVSGTVDLAVLGRTLEVVPQRRLQRIILDDGALHFFDDRLFDTATHADCSRVAVGDGARCVPAVLAPATTLFAPGCGAPVHVAGVRRHACATPAFASDAVDGMLEIRAIGDPMTATLFQFDGAQCEPYTVAADTELHAVGPPLDLATFVGAIYYGER